MCQLTLTYFKNNPILTRFNVINAAVINPLRARMAEHTGHVDGYGYFINRKSLWKTKFPGHEIDFSRVIFTSDPVISHVRKTTRGKVSKENAHPFEFEHFIAAHNGTLSGGFIDLNTEDITDSEKFMRRVEEIITKEKLDVLHAFKKAYDEIDGGKFAFLVYDKVRNKYYVIRGQAPLHYAEIYNSENKIIGVIVNTEDDSLQMQLYLLRAHYGVSFSEVKLLEANTIYELDEGNIKLVKIEDIKIIQRDIVKKVVYNVNDYWTAVTKQKKGKKKEEKKGKKKKKSLGLFDKNVKKIDVAPRNIYGAILFSLLNTKENLDYILDILEDRHGGDPLISYAKPIIVSEDAAELIHSSEVVEIIRDIRERRK